MKDEQCEALVKSLKRATKSNRPFSWWFVTSAEDGKPALLVGRKAPEVKAEAREVKKSAKEKRTARGPMVTNADGNLVFALEEGQVKPKLVQRTFKVELSKDPGLKKVKGLLQRALVVPIEELGAITGDLTGQDTAAPDVEAQLEAVRLRAKGAFVGARERLGAEAPELVELTKLRDVATAARKGGDLLAAVEAYEELIEACEAADATDVGAADVGDDVVVDEATVRELAAVWREAIEDADAQLSALRNALLRDDDPDLRDIAEFGLNALTANHRVRLQAALFEAQHGGPEARFDALARLSEIAESFLDHVRGSSQFDVCDDNPFGVKVALRATLVPALTRLSTAA